MTRDEPDYMMVGIFIGVVLIVIFGGVVWCMNDTEEEASWQRFKLEHKCKVVGHVKGQCNYAWTKSGGIVCTDDQTTWSCDDGMTYTR